MDVWNRTTPLPHRCRKRVLTDGRCSSNALLYKNQLTRVLGKHLTVMLKCLSSCLCCSLAVWFKRERERKKMHEQELMQKRGLKGVFASCVIEDEGKSGWMKRFWPLDIALWFTHSHPTFRCLRHFCPFCFLLVLSVWVCTRVSLCVSMCLNEWMTVNQVFHHSLIAHFYLSAPPSTHI